MAAATLLSARAHRNRPIPTRGWLARGVAALVLPLLLACGDDAAEAPVTRDNPVVPLDTGTVVIETASDTFQLSVEIAETPNQRQIGLMERLNLPEDEGMIFLSYEESDSTAGFWMFRTRIPLDIAYLDQQGAIVAIRAMEPCSSQYISGCPTYPAGVPFWAALEVTRGYFDSRDIGIGDRVTLRQGGRLRPLSDSTGV